MTKLTGLYVEITGDNKSVDAALKGTQRQLVATGVSVDTTKAKVTSLATTGFGKLGSMSSQTKGKIQQVSYQVQDMAVQFGAGARASTVLAQQGSQMLSVFGPMGMILGTIAAVAIPALAMAFFDASSKTKDFATSLDEAKAALDRLKNAAAVFSAEGIQGLIDKYGELNAEVLHFIDLQRQVAVAEAMREAREAVSALVEEIPTGWFMGQTDEVRTFFDTTNDGAREIIDLFAQIKNAKTFDEQLRVVVQLRQRIEDMTGGIKGNGSAQDAFLMKILDTEDALRQMNHQGDLASGWLNSAISGASSLAARLWDAAAAAIKIRTEQAEAANANTPPFGVRPKRAPNGIGGVDWGAPPASRGGGGGGGGGVNPVVGQLESLRTSLLTQEEAQIASYQRQQETLQAALEQRLITQQEYQALMEQAQSQHSDAMASIDAYRYGSGLQQAEAFFGDMADALASGNEEMMRIAKVFGAAEALINAWRAYSQTLADPTLPFLAKFAAAAKVLAAGLGAVNAIKGAGKGGAGAGAGSAQAAAAAPQPLQVRLNGVTPGSLVSGADIGALLDRLGDEAGDRGYRLMIAR